MRIEVIDAGVASRSSAANGVSVEDVVTKLNAWILSLSVSATNNKSSVEWKTNAERFLNS